MIPDIGHYALVLALCIALVQSTVPLLGARTGSDGWMAVARPAAAGQFGFVLIAFAALAYTFVVNDFSVVYVAQNSNTALPLMYRLSAVWAAHEGSLLLWVLILSGWSLAVAVFSRRLPRDVASTVLAVMGMISVGFLLFMLGTSNPFLRQLPAPLQGRNLNPLLQDPGLAIHPPMLYMGYVGFSVAFAFAIAALINGRLDAAWARWTRPWTTGAWLFLTLGITLGSWWAYRELGWGGWWFWDPVENASFMPWLVGTALIHSLAVTEKRGAFKGWTVLLAISAFSLSLLGTFLVRSGVLVSVHAFATDPARGVYILAFLATVVGGSMVLYALRAPRLRGTTEVRWLSREGLLLLNNLLLVVAAASVLLGTLYPLVLDTLGVAKISVGPPYFNTVFVPLTLPLVFLAGLAMLVRWKHSNWREVLRRACIPAMVAVALGVAFPWLALGAWSLTVTAALILAFWAIAAAFQEPLRRMRNRGAGLSGLRRMPRGAWGMTVAHCGLGLFVIGVVLVSAFNAERTVSLAPGDTATLAGYTFLFKGTEQVAGPNYSAERGSVYVERDGEPVTLLHPEKRHYGGPAMPAMTEAGIASMPTRDLYVSLGEPLDNGAWSMRLYYKPFVSWIWLGGFVMTLGGLLAATDRRYRLPVHRLENTRRDVAATPAPAPVRE